MITDPDPSDPTAQLAALRAKLAGVRARQQTTTDPRELWHYACDLQDAIWSLQAVLGMVMLPMRTPDA